MTEKYDVSIAKTISSNPAKKTYTFYLKCCHFFLSNTSVRSEANGHE